MFAWLTPDALVVPSRHTWTLLIEDQFVEHVRGALGELCDWWNWEQRGNITPNEAAAAMFTSWLSFRRSILLGTIHEYLTSTLPDGVLLCDGTVYARVDYPDLYAVLDDAYIDDADHFHTPNLVNRSTMGTALDQGVEGGEAEHILSVAEMPTHNHSIPGPSTFPYGNIPEVTVVGGVLTQYTGDAGGGQAHNNVHPVHKTRFGMVAR